MRLSDTAQRRKSTDASSDTGDADTLHRCNLFDQLLRMWHRLRPQIARLARVVPSLAARYRFERQGVVSALSQRPAEAIPPDWLDLATLYDLVRQRRPQCILEIGSGCSTLVLAQALADNASAGDPGGALYSVESDDHWASVTRESLPPRLQHFAQILQSPAVPTDYDGTLVLRHAQLPDVSPDFMYVDGPPLTAVHPIAVDALVMEEKLRPNSVIIVDGRRANAVFLHKHFSRPHHFTWRRLAGQGVFEFQEGPLASVR